MDYEIELDDDTIETCYHQGACYDDCKDALNALPETHDIFKITQADAIKGLKTYGAWELKELQSMEYSELLIKILWIAAAQCKDDNTNIFYFSTY